MFGVMYFVPNFCTLPFVLRYGHVVSPRARIRFGYTVFLLCLIVPSIHSGGLGQGLPRYTTSFSSST